MALIAKIDAPLSMAADGVAQIHARPYRQAAVQAGEEVFVWTSEASGGHGLAARGSVLAAEIGSFPNTSGPGEHKELVLDIRVIDAAPLRPLSLGQIAPHRDSDGEAPETAISKVPHRHALNKITSMESDVADFVRSHFKEQ